MSKINSTVIAYQKLRNEWTAVFVNGCEEGLPGNKSHTEKGTSRYGVC